MDTETYDDRINELAVRVDMLRRRHGIRQYEVAEEMGVGQDQLSQWLNLKVRMQNPDQRLPQLEQAIERLENR